MGVGGLKPPTPRNSNGVKRKGGGREREKDEEEERESERSPLGFGAGSTTEQEGRRAAKEKGTMSNVSAQQVLVHCFSFT